jgi:hypothetical protein
MKRLGVCMAMALFLVSRGAATGGAADEKREPQKAPTGQTDAEKKGYDIMLKNYEQMTTKNFRSDVKMELIDLQSKVQTRHLKRLSKTGEDDCEKYHIKFVDPPTIRNTTLLILENTDREDDVWFYLPGLKKTQRISGANLRTSYMGTEFSFKDLKREKVPAGGNRYVLVETVELDGVKQAVMDAFPVTDKEKDEQGYQRRRLWVRLDNYLVTRIDYFDEDGTSPKKLLFSDMRPVGKSGRIRYFQAAMTNKKGVKTIIKFELMRIDDEEISDQYFTKDSLTKER